jgi:threonine dehydrogenase-like Zn-dependent dehydrogenase
VKALVFTRPSTVELLDVDEPVVPEGEVAVRVDAVGICGSELHGVRDTDFRTPPLVMGHELSGTTDDGRRVTVNPLLSCGACDRCRDGDEHLCRSRAIVGIHRAGAFAQTVVVPDAAVHELPDTMSFETAAMVEPLANAIHAFRLADPRPGSKVAIIGAGTIGLVSLLVALDHGAEVTVCDLAKVRLKLARRLGAATVTPRLTGEFDVIVDAVGAAATHRISLDVLRPGGVAVWIGLLSADAAFDGQEIVRSEKRVLGSYCYRPDEFVEALRMADRLPLDWTSSYPLEHGARIFTQLMNGRQDVIKALLRPGAGSGNGSGAVR